MGDGSAMRSGKMTMGDAANVFRQRLDGQQNIKEGAKVYRRKCVDALLKSWPELEEKPVGKVSKDEFVNAPTMMFDKFDANKDGVLDAQELEAARAAAGKWRERRTQQ